MEHRGDADVDRADRTGPEWRHEAELEPERCEADVLVLMPRGERAAWVRAELADVLHLEHGADQDGAVLRVGVDEALRTLRVHHVPCVDIALVHPVRRSEV